MLAQAKLSVNIEITEQPPQHWWNFGAIGKWDSLVWRIDRCHQCACNAGADLHIRIEEGLTTMAP